MRNILGLWKNLKELISLYKTYEIGKIYKPYTWFGIKHSWRLLMLYKDKENNA